jgi:hypothetical protein
MSAENATTPKTNEATIIRRNPGILALIKLLKAWDTKLTFRLEPAEDLETGHVYFAVMQCAGYVAAVRAENIICYLGVVG